jgi:hypothetical protein
MNAFDLLPSIGLLRLNVPIPTVRISARSLHSFIKREAFNQIFIFFIHHHFAGKFADTTSSTYIYIVLALTGQHSTNRNHRKRSQMDQAKGARGFKNGHILGARSVCGPSITYCTICLHLLHSCKQAAPASCEKHMRNNLLYTLVSSATTMFHCAHGPVLHHQYLFSHKKRTNKPKLYHTAINKLSSHLNFASLDRTIQQSKVPTKRLEKTLDKTLKN